MLLKLTLGVGLLFAANCNLNKYNKKIQREIEEFLGFFWGGGTHWNFHDNLTGHTIKQQIYI